MWDLPGPGLEPVSLALAGSFLTTVPPRKPHQAFLYTPCLLLFLKKIAFIVLHSIAFFTNQRFVATLC